METNIFTEGMMKGPEGTLLRFFYDSAKNEGASTAAGRAIFDTVLCVDVITPGQKASTPRFELERIFSDIAKESLGLVVPYKRSYKYDEYKEQIERFKADEKAHDLGGTPLKMWPRIDRGLAATLAAVNIFTVEALAELSDVNLQNLGLGARELREQAKAWLGNADDTAGMSKVVAENESLKQDSQRVQSDLAAANARIAELERMVEKAGGNTDTAKQQRRREPEPLV